MYTGLIDSQSKYIKIQYIWIAKGHHCQHPCVCNQAMIKIPIAFANGYYVKHPCVYNLAVF